MKVFCSYSQNDKELVTKVKERLYKNGFDVFDQNNDISIGSNLLSAINDAINSSDAVLFFISKNTGDSYFMQQEISLAVSNKLNGKEIKLIPIKLDEGAEIPFFLKDYLYLDASDPSDFEMVINQLTIDLQKENKSSIKNDQAIKFEQLKIEKELLLIERVKQEEYEKYKIRQISFITAMIAGVALLIASLSVFSYFININNYFKLLIAFSFGVIASTFAASSFMKQKNKKTDDILRKINELNELMRRMEARNGK